MDISRTVIIKRFTQIWLVVSLLVSAHWAFNIFPKEYNKIYGATVELYFQTEQNSKVIYRPNNKTYREKYLTYISDTDSVYFDSCDLLKYDVNITCDDTSNWKKVNLKQLNCSNIKSCITPFLVMSRPEKIDYLISLVKENNLSNNKTLVKQIKDGSPANKSNIDIQNPISWGEPDISKWGVFVLLFLVLIKVGRSLGEYVFSTYEE